MCRPALEDMRAWPRHGPTAERRGFAKTGAQPACSGTLVPCAASPVRGVSVSRTAAIGRDARSSTPRRQLLARDRQRVRENGRLIRCAIEPQRVLLVELGIGWKHHTRLRRARENMAASAAIKPIGIIEGAGAHPQDVREALQVEAKCRATAIAELDGNAPVA